MDKEVKQISDFIGVDLRGVRVTERNGKLYFDATGLRKVFQIKDLVGAMAEVDESDKILVDGVVYVNESGLYTLLFESPLPRAKNFTRWVSNEVIPTVTLTGQYPVPDKILN